MRDPLLAEIAALFHADVPPAVAAPAPTGLAPMAAVDEPVRGPSRQLVFHAGAGRMYLQLDGPLLTGVLDDRNVTVEVRSPEQGVAIRPDAEGWFRAEVAPGPVCVCVPELGLTTGWFVA
ncbi:hypothetical protein [Nocardia sp. NRRL S-836]|uniref:hypothetical protein n=1 Tax=Nocardia sp. NRRL S-836 TaxID=1519492 RepID=UPI0006AEE8CE|nr:hypothetical protein [Nocardia sp. NRRL S-836]KOV80946.1 hypothetical protein ADL03_31030 [Nocardia sp. NRRL S-836]